MCSEHFDHLYLQKLSLTRARELRVQTVRLPIDEYMVRKSNSKNFHSKILAINQGELIDLIYSTYVFLFTQGSSLPTVFDILLMFCKTGSWTESLQTWFPHAKGYIIPPTVAPLPTASATQDTGQAITSPTKHPMQ